jgi:hypothetical protein
MRTSRRAEAVQGAARGSCRSCRGGTMKSRCRC